MPGGLEPFASRVGAAPKKSVSYHMYVRIYIYIWLHQLRDWAQIPNGGAGTEHNAVFGGGNQGPARLFLPARQVW